MPYEDIESGLAAVIATNADFSTSSNVVRGDWRVMAIGLNRIAVLSYGGHTREEFTLQRHLDTWTVNVDLLVLYRGEQSLAHTDMIAERQKILDTVGQFPLLNGTTGVLDAAMTAPGTPEPISINRTSYLHQQLVCTVKEVFNPNRQE